jgi:hypothetical protein
VLRNFSVLIALAATSLLAESSPPPSQTVAAIDADLAQKLLNAKRVFVESFGDDGVNKSLTAMVLDSLRTSKRFIITENREKADLILKGTALEKTTQEYHALGSATSVAGAASGHSSTVVGTPNVVVGSSQGGSVSHSAAIEDSQASTETIETARVAVRLVTPDGDIVWSTTQESRGGKYKGAAGDVAEKVVKELVRELDRLSKK